MSAVTLKDCSLEKLTLKDRKMIKQLSAKNILQPSGNVYVSEPIDTTVRDEPDPPPLCNPAPPDSRRQSQISVTRSQSLRVVRAKEMHVVHVHGWYTYLRYLSETWDIASLSDPLPRYTYSICLHGWAAIIDYVIMTLHHKCRFSTNNVTLCIAEQI